MKKILDSKIIRFYEEDFELLNFLKSEHLNFQAFTKNLLSKYMKHRKKYYDYRISL